MAKTASKVSLTTDRKELLSAMEQCGSALGKSTVPILSNLLFKVDDGELSITGSDVETTIIRKVDVTSLSSFEFVVSPLRFIPVIKGSNSKEVEIAYGSREIEVIAGTVKSKFQTLDADDYPDISIVDRKDYVQFTASFGKFRQALEYALSARLADQKLGIHCHPWLCGRGDYLEVIGTDKTRMHISKVEIEEPCEKSFPLLWSVARAVVGLNLADTELLTIQICETATRVETPRRTIFGGCPYGDIPSVSKIIPTSHAREWTVESSALSQAANLAIPFNAACRVQLSYSNECITVEAAGPDTGELTQQIPAIGLGDSDDFRIVVNAKSIVDAVKNTKAVKIQTTGPRNFLKIINVDDENIFAVIGAMAENA